MNTDLGRRRPSELFSKRSCPEEELWERDQYQRLKQEIQRLEREVDGEKEWEMVEP